MPVVGQKIVWTIDFHISQNSLQKPQKPEVSFVPKQYHVGSPPLMAMEAPMRDKAQAFLNKIQDMCNKITADCQKEAVTDMDYLKKTHLVKKELGALDELIKKLNEILRWLRPPESKGNRDFP